MCFSVSNCFLLLLRNILFELVLRNVEYIDRKVQTNLALNSRILNIRGLYSDLNIDFSICRM